MSFNSRTREGCDLSITSSISQPRYVSIHAPGRGATNSQVNSQTLPTCFNSRTREGCDMAQSLPLTKLPVFQFTHPGGVRPGHTWREIVRREFQFTHPGGVRRRQSLGIRPNHIRFNSRTREGCDKPERTLSGRLKVSIHAPGRGATILPLMVELLRRVSIHAPGRGATKSHRRQELIQRSFNSRTREGCDSLWCRRSPWPRCFNSRTREGCDPFSGPSVILIYGFQFTHPGGVRLDPH